MSAAKPIDDRIRAYDDGGKHADRYTVVYIDSFTDHPLLGRSYACVGMNDEPFHPQGIGQHGEIYKPGRHLGKRINFSDLPEDCQRLVLMDLADMDSN